MKRYPSGVPVGTPYGQQAYDEDGKSLGVFLPSLSEFTTDQPQWFFVKLFEGEPVAYHVNAGPLKTKTPLYSVRVACTEKFSRIRQGLFKGPNGEPTWINIRIMEWATNEPSDKRTMA